MTFPLSLEKWPDDPRVVDVDNDESGTEATITVVGDNDPEVAGLTVVIETLSDQRIHVVLNEATLYLGDPEVTPTPAEALAIELMSLVWRDNGFTAVHVDEVSDLLQKHGLFDVAVKPIVGYIFDRLKK